MVIQTERTLPGALARVILVAFQLSLVQCAAVSRNEAFIGYHERDSTHHASFFTPPLGNPGAVNAIFIQTEYGITRIKLLRTLAPETCRIITDLALHGQCVTTRCRFYRHEPVPDNWGIHGNFGPPYALLQGGLGLTLTPHYENPNQTPVLKGMVAMIPNSKEFFIATADHTEWGASFTVWGEVDSLDMEQRIPFEPYRLETDPTNITTRWLEKDIPFTIGVTSV